MIKTQEQNIDFDNVQHKIHLAWLEVKIHLVDDGFLHGRLLNFTADASRKERNEVVD